MTNNNRTQKKKQSKKVAATRDEESSESSSSEESSEQSSSEQSSSSDDDRQSRRRKHSRSNSRKHSSKSSRKDTRSNTKKQTILERKQKTQIAQSTRKIEIQGTVIESLQTELSMQRHNLDELEREKMILKADADKVITMQSEKAAVVSNLQAQKMQMQRVKNMIERKQSIATEAKADDFNDAVHHAHHTPTHPDEDVPQQSKQSCLSKISDSIIHHYLLSSLVFRIANSCGAKSQVFFSENATMLNTHLFTALIFIPFYLTHQSTRGFSGIDSLFMHTYDQSEASIYVLSIVGKEADSGRRLKGFKLTFGSWNWKIKDASLVARNQLVLAQHIIKGFNFEDARKSTFKGQRTKSILSVILIRVVTVAFIILSCVGVYILLKKELISFENNLYLTVLADGILASVVMKVSVSLIELIHRFEAARDLESANGVLYVKRFVGTIAPIFVALLMNISTVFYFSGTSSTFLSMFFNDSEKVNGPYDSLLFVCREQQAGYGIVGLAVGLFLVSLVWEIVESVVLKLIKKSPIEFDAMDSSVSLLVLNFVLCALIPFNLFAPLLAIVLHLLNFFVHWAMQIYMRLPQSSGFSDTMMQAAISGYQNIIVLLIFTFYAAILSFQFPAVKYSITTPENQDFVCNPLVQSSNMSVMERIRSQASNWDWLLLGYEIVTWQQLNVGLLVMFFTGFIILLCERGLWEKELQRKLGELTGIKGYYEKKINRLEQKIDEANRQLEDPIFNGLEENNHRQDQDDFNLGSNHNFHSQNQQQQPIVQVPSSKFIGRIAQHQQGGTTTMVPRLLADSMFLNNSGSSSKLHIPQQIQQQQQQQQHQQFSKFKNNQSISAVYPAPSQTNLMPSQSSSTFIPFNVSPTKHTRQMISTNTFLDSSIKDDSSHVGREQLRKNSQKRNQTKLFF